MKAAQKYPTIENHNISVFSRRMNVDIPSDDFCQQVWKFTRLSGKSYRSTLAAVIAKVVIERKLYNDVDLATKEASLIGFFVGQLATEEKQELYTGALTGDDPLIKYLLNEFEKRFGKSKPGNVEKTIRSMYTAKELYIEYSQHRQTQRDGSRYKSGGTEAAMAILAPIFKDSRQVAKNMNASDDLTGYF